MDPLALTFETDPNMSSVCGTSPEHHYMSTFEIPQHPHVQIQEDRFLSVAPTPKVSIGQILKMPVSTPPTFCHLQYKT